MTELDPPRSFGFRGIDGPIRATERSTVEPVGEGQSRFIMALDFEGHGIGKILIQQCSRVLEAPNQHTFLTRWNP